MKPKHGIQQKLTRLIVLISMISLLAASGCSVISMLLMRKGALSTTTSQAEERMYDYATNKAELADAKLLRAQQQTQLVASGIETVLKNADKHLQGFNENNTFGLPDLICVPGGKVGKYIFHVVAPEEILKNKMLKYDGSVSYAEINREAKINSKYTINQELYFGSLITSQLSQVVNFKNEDGTYTGFASTFFCFDDSGIDILGDGLSTDLVAYDARNSEWYQETVKAYEENELNEDGVYWTEPVQDGFGRGLSVACTAPVVVGGKLVGCAGSGGTLGDFSELIAGSAFGSGYSFIVSNKTSKVIVNPHENADSSAASEVAVETILSESKNPELVELAQKIKSDEPSEIDIIKIDGTDYYITFTPLSTHNWTMITIVSCNDNIIVASSNNLNKQILITLFLFIFLIIAIVVGVWFITKKFSTEFTVPIIELKDGVDKIGQGNLDYKLDIKTDDEIEQLGNAFNDMAKNLDKYIKDYTAVATEKERIGAELDVAKNIQASMLPCIFPAFPEMDEFDIYATMTPAKEVGGDFYDFFMIDDTHLAIVMADVSGKGIPAALFMVIGKTLIKDHTHCGRDLGDVFSEVNNLLCESNSQDLFITAFEGVLDLETGEFCFVNAGHEMPFIYKKSEGYAPYKIKPGFVLAGMENMRYRSGILTLEPGDKLFQYTDGVTEATDKNNTLYGMDRLSEILNKCKDSNPKDTLAKVKEDIDKFVGEAPQFDDITMLCLEYFGTGDKSKKEEDETI